MLKIDIIRAVAKKFGRPVDLINISTAGEPILGQVLAGKKLFGDSTLHARLLTLHIIDNADFMPLRQRTLKEKRGNWIP